MPKRYGRAMAHRLKTWASIPQSDRDEVERFREFLNHQTKDAAYLLANADYLGFTEEERAAIASRQGSEGET